MKSRLMQLLVLVCLVGLLPGCIIESSSPDRDITCANFDDFLRSCTSNCSPTWDCELNYDSLDIGTQITLDGCSDCLYDSLAGGTCADCSVPSEGVSSCWAFMEDFLGVDCW